MKSRYDRNQKLYEKVKNNDYEDYNTHVKDLELEFTPTESRKDFHEKKRLSLYFKDIENELEQASSKLNNISEDSGLEIKKNVDLKSLIEQAKQNQREQGSGLFSNTQYEILSSLNVEESQPEEDEEDLELHDLVGKTEEINLEDSRLFVTNFNEISDDLQPLDENFAPTMEEEASELTEEVEEALEEIDNEESDDDFFGTEPVEVVEEDLVEINESDEEFFAVDAEEDQSEEHIEDTASKNIEEVVEVKEEQVEEKPEVIENVKEKDEEKEKRESMVTYVLLFLILVLLVVGLVIVSQYVGGF